MYLKGSKFSIQSRRKRGNPWLILFLVLAIAGLIYLNVVVVPMINPPFVPTPPTPTRDPESYVIEADTLAEEGKYIQAVEVYQQAINANPHNLDNYLKIARLQIFTSQLEQAQVNAQNAILLDNNSSEAYALLGWAKAFQREYLAGEADLRKAVELNQNSGLAHAIYAYVLALRVEARMDDLDTMDRAIEESRTALALEPNLMEAHWARGYVLEVTANFAEAVESLKIANQINPPNVDRLHMALGRNLTYIDQLDQAVFEFTKAYSLNPPTSPPAPNLAISQVYSRLGEFDKAIQYGEVALRDGPTQANLYANLGTLYYRKSQFNTAIEYLRIAVRGGAYLKAVWPWKVSRFPMTWAWLKFTVAMLWLWQKSTSATKLSPSPKACAKPCPTARLARKTRPSSFKSAKKTCSTRPRQLPRQHPPWSLVPPPHQKERNHKAGLLCTSTNAKTYFISQSRRPTHT